MSDNTQPKIGGLYAPHYIKLYQDNPPGYGAVDVLCMGSARLAERLGEMVFILCMTCDADGRWPFSRIRIVLPPASASPPGVDESAVRKAAQDAVGKVRGAAITLKEAETLAKRLEVVRSPDLEVDSVLAVGSQAERRSVVVVCDAAKYRDQEIAQSEKPKRDGATFPDDIWIPHLSSLAARCVAVAKDGESYIALDAGEFAPYREENTQRLTAIEGIGVFVVSESEGIAQIVAAHSEQWSAFIKTGRIGAALASIDALPETADQYKDVIKAQMLHRAGLHLQAVELVRKRVASEAEIAPDLRVRLARIAADGAEPRLAAELLRPAVALLPSQELLEQAHSVAQEIGDRYCEAACFERLRAAFPKAHRVQWNRLLALLNVRQYGGIGELLSERTQAFAPETVAFYGAIVNALDVRNEPRYGELIDAVAPQWPALLEQGRAICMRDAEARGLFAQALALSLRSAEKGLSGVSARAVLRTMEKVLLQRNADGEPIVDAEELRKPLTAVIVYLSRNAADTETRAALARLLSVRMSGSIGLPLMAVVTIDLAQRGTPLRDAGRAGRRPKRTKVELEPFLKAAFSWLEREGPIQLGRFSLPKEMLTAPADDLLFAMTELVQYTGARLVGERDRGALENFIAVGSLIAPHSSTPDEDLTVLRLGAGKLALAGRVQRARDLAEQALQMAGNDAHRTRLAWFAFADVYHRLHNFLEALTGMACALASDVEITVEQAWYETYGLIRLLRDLNLIELAKPLLPLSRELLGRLGVEKENAHRLDTIDLGVRMQEVSRETPLEATKLRALIGDLAKNCEAVLDRDDEATPVASLLAQSIYLARYFNIAFDSAAGETLGHALGVIGEPTGSMLRTVSTPSPAAGDVVRLAGRLEQARYAEDVGFDVRALVIAAHRLLDSAEAAKDARVAALAIELLADQAVTKPATSAGAPPAFSSIEGAGKLAEEISRSGIAVMLLGLSELGRLARVTARNGVLGRAVHEPTDIFSRKRFAEWSEKFPYQYGNLSDVGNEIYTSMRGLGISSRLDERTVLITDISLQQLPPNLLLATDNFAGRVVPMAAAPSLSWLSAVRGARLNESKRAVAWISTATEQGRDPTLVMVAERLQATLQEHGIELHTEPAIPENIEGSELTVIAAHGGIIPEGRYFQVVADDGKLRVDSRSLARALPDTRLVILFVCSAGRFDKHPLASTTVGLAKELLDRGCCTVIGSPWPLDARVPSHWLPAFLDAWGKGQPVIDANFVANNAVAKAMGDSPAYCLAMTVFGDPMLLKNP